MKQDFSLLNVSRRQFMGRLGSSAFVLAIGLPRHAFAQENAEGEKEFGADAMPHGWRDDPHLFVAIGENGTVTLTCHRSEMGQGVRTSIAMVLADELEADWPRVQVDQAPGDEARYGNQDTDGSRSLRHFYMPMRRAGAAARAMLEQAAAAQWDVPVSEVRAHKHTVTHAGSGRSLDYGELAKAASELPVPDRNSLQLKDPKEFRYIGSDSIGLVDNFDITTGKASYGIDTRLEGMLYAVIARPPVVGGKVASYDPAETLKIPGVVDVVPLGGPPAIPLDFEPLGGIAVVARNTWAALRGRQELKIEWDDGPNAVYSSDTYREQLEEAVRKPGKAVRAQGNLDKAMAGAAKRVEAEYYIPHLAQVPMEPPSAVARIVDGRCEAWACTQAPQVTRDKLAQHLGLPAENVTVHVTLLGGGFGRKSKPDFVTEAGLVSKAMNGAPVKLTWTREDDLQHGYYHTVSLERLEGGLDAEGRTIAWLHRTAAPTIGSLFAPDPKHESPMELGMGVTNTPFTLENYRAENPEAPAYVRIGWYRSVSNIPHAFAIQSFAAELAHAAGRDPKDYLLDLIGPPGRINPTEIGDVWNYGEDPERYPIDRGRLRRVVETAAQKAGWGRQMPKGRGLGIACHYSFLSYAAVVAEVEVGDDGSLAIPAVDVAFDCGPQVNPERIRSQLEGAVIMGIGQTMSAAVTFSNGRAEQGNFDTYEITRMDAAPREIRITLIPADDPNGPLGGVGEPGLPPVVPAITNAVFAATGKRIRRLPIGSQLAT